MRPFGCSNIAGWGKIHEAMGLMKINRENVLLVRVKEQRYRREQEKELDVAN